MKSIISTIAVIIAVAYPLMVYFGLEGYGPRGLALLLFVVTLLKMLIIKDKNKEMLLGHGVLLLFCLTIMIVQSEQLLRFYPVIMSVGVAALFFFSLWDEQTVIEKIARLGGANITPLAKGYIRVLTRIWVVLLLLNALAAAYTALFMSLYHWTLYNGLISYLILGGFMLGEYIYRQRYKRRHGEA